MGSQQQWGLIPSGNSSEVLNGPQSSALVAAPVDSGFTWEQAVRVVRKNIVLSLVFIGLATAMVAAVAFRMKNFYQPVARVEVDPVGSGMKTLGEIQWNTDQNDENYVETQTQLLQGDSLAVSVIRALRLDRNPEFVGKDPKKSGQIAGFKEETESETPHHDEYLREQFDLANRTPLESIALSSFAKRLSVNTIHSTRVIEISFSSQDPQLAKNILNTLVTQYLEQNFRMRHTASMQASEWLATQLEDLRHGVAEANQAVTDYQKHYGLVELDDRDIPMGQLMYEVNHQVSQAQASRIEQEAYVRMIDAGEGSAVPAVRDDQLYQTLMARYNDARAHLARDRSVYGDENSVVKKLQDESSELKAQVEAERNRMINQVRTSYRAARDAEQMLVASKEKLRVDMGDASSRMTQFRLLRNQAVANSELYNTLRGRLVEAGIYAGLKSSNIHVVDLAPRLPKPSGPHRGLIIVMGFAVSCVLAVILSFVKESFNNTVRTPDDLKEWLGLPSLAMIPPMGLKGNGANGHRPRLRTLTGGEESKIQLAHPHTAAGEAMSDLRTALMLSGQGAPRVILVTSGLPGEGKTTVAMNLAIAFVQCGKTCLLDGDLRQSTIAEAVGLRGGIGLQNVLEGSASLEDALVTAPEVSGLSLLTITAIPSSPIDLIASEKMPLLVADLRKRFQYVIIDSSPVIPYSDARILSSYADVVILVGRYGLTTRRAIGRCAQLLEEVNARVAGVVVNGIDVASPDYRYYNYGYSMSRNGRANFVYTPEARQAAANGSPAKNENIKSKGAHS
jgi:capsular exopolysaccharide synthesis family protein